MNLRGLADYHMHTTLCGHAEGTIDQYIEKALELGLDEVGFSEHIYLYHLPPGQRDPELAMREEEMPHYVEAIEEARVRYPHLPIRLGLEADYIRGHVDALRLILERYNWDYVYGSVHFLGDWGFDDPRYEAQYSKWQIEDLYEIYFTHVKEAARTGLFDIMAHLDLVKKFGYRPSTEPEELYRDVASALAGAGVCIEASSGGLRVAAAEQYPSLGLLKACRQAGVPATLGSDAHKPEHVGFAFPQLVETLREAGYSQSTRFSGRRRSLHDLPRNNPKSEI